MGSFEDIMNIRIVRLDLTETNEQLRRIANALEGILGATDPIPAGIEDFPNEPDRQRVFYTDDMEEIVAHHVTRLGKEVKPFIRRK